MLSSNGLHVFLIRELVRVRGILSNFFLTFWGLFCFQFYLIDSENLEYVGSGTFYRTEKACSVAEM